MFVIRSPKTRLAITVTFKNNKPNSKRVKFTRVTNTMIIKLIKKLRLVWKKMRSQRGYDLRVELLWKIPSRTVAN